MPIYFEPATLTGVLIGGLIGALPVLLCLLAKCTSKLIEEYVWSAIELWEFSEADYSPARAL